MKHLAIAAVLAAVPGSMVYAADAGWAGPYAGVRLGLETYNTQFSDLDDTYDNQGVNGDTSVAFSPGIVGGWNFETEGFVYGGELSYDFNGAESGSKPYGTGDPGLMETELKSVIALKGRAGIASGNNLVYVTAGYVSAKIDSTYNDTGVAGANDSFSDTVGGLTYGVGVERQFMPMLSARLQLSVTELETTDLSTLTSGSTMASTSSLNGFGITVAYKF